MKKSFTAVLFFVAIAASAQEAPTLDSVIDRSFKVDLFARVTDKDENVLWSMESTTLTMAGRPVPVKLEISNVTIQGNLIPVIRKENNLFLMVQGEIWIRKQQDNVEYYNTLNTVPISSGEPVYFFPLGKSENSDEWTYILEIEITITKYRELLQEGQEIP